MNLGPILTKCDNGASLVAEQSVEFALDTLKTVILVLVEVREPILFIVTLK